ncbi:MAG: T9SS type A sorting domain-containing protein, partial [Bacteroidota bacterium]
IGIWNRALTQQEITQLYNANICYQYITVTDTLIINANLTSVNPVTYQNTIRIYPNPTNDHITIDYGNFATLSGYQLKIENSLGQQMFQTTINQQSSYINLNGWTGNGLYFVHLIDPQGNTIDIRKIVLQ